MLTFSRLGGCLLVAMIPLGCGGGRAAVTGAVTLDRAPLQAGHITFVPIEATPGPGARGQIVKGRYAIDSAHGPGPGVYRVEISGPRKTGRRVPAGSPSPAGTMTDEEVEAVPDRFNKRSTLREELKSGANRRDFALSSSAIP